MSDTHVRDPSWKTDLIWHYFHTVTTEAKAPAAYRKFYSNQDASDELDSRHRVYEMLVDEQLHTLPTLAATADASMENYKKSKLPWNQNNDGFLKAVNNEIGAVRSSRSCSSAIWVGKWPNRRRATR